jgi:hypothetical protein
MGSLYVKGAKLWARYKDEHGVWKGAPTPYRPGDEGNARRFLKTLEAATDAKSSFIKRTGGERKGPITVADYAVRWTDDRKELGLASAGDDLTRLRFHILPTLGTMPVEALRPRHIRDLVLDLRKQAVLAPRTIEFHHPRRR